MKALASIISSVNLNLVELISPAELGRQLLSRESTGAAVVACSEMSYVDSCFPADPSLPVFVWQNFGGCLSDSGGLSEIVQGKEITNVVFYGHYPCSVIEMALRAPFNSAEASVDIRQQFARRAAETRQAIYEQFGNDFDKEIMLKATEDFVLRQMGGFLKLVTPGSERARKLRCHAWISHCDNADVMCFEPRHQTFVNLA